MVSVIVPIYNSEDTIKGCISSIVEQSLDDIEIILVDDGSTDQSGRICDDFATKDSRIIVIHQKNKGRTVARFEGVKHAKGDWIAFVDSDDQLPVDAIEVLYKKTDENTDIVLGNGYSLRNEHRETIPINDFRHLAVRGDGTIGVPWGSLYRSEKLTPYLFDLSRDVVSGEDYIFWLRLVFSTEKPVKVVYQRVYNKSTDRTSGYFQWTADYAQMLNELRMGSIPSEQRQLYFNEVLHDRIANLFDIAVSQPRKEWSHSKFYQDILKDTKLSWKQRLFLAVPSLRIRKMISSNNSILYFLLLLMIGIGMLFLYFFDVPTLSDDMVYRFMWNKNEADTVQLINNINDLFYSQWNHYFSVNGRTIVHLLAQFFLVFIPPVVLQIINTILFVVLLYLIANYITKDIKERLFVSCISFFLFFVVFQGFRTAILWGLGTFNYSWVLVATMMLLLLFQRIENKKTNKKYLLLSPLALIVGWSHEGLAIPLSCSFIFYFFINRKVLFGKAIFPYMLFFIIGSIVIMLSPGIWNRSMGDITIKSRIISGIINLCFNVRIFWLLLLTLLITWRKNKSLLKQHFRSCKYGYVTLLVSLGIILVCGTNLERVAFFSDYVAMLLLLSLLIKVISWKWMKRSMAVCGIIVLLFYIPAYAVRKENSDNWNYLEKQIKTPNQELISVRYPIKGNNLLMDYFREHYINPSVEFGFYCIYMAFDSNDINMRCVARMYDKPRLTFLPEDIIDKVNSDSMAYKDYELDEHQSLFVWKLPEDKKVNKLTFILGYEDISKLSFPQRILAYKEDTYELDDFHFEVVNISGNSYLIFTRPTTNIYRRINKIELQ